MKKSENNKIAFFFYEFILWLIESALAEGVSKLYFFTREGEFFKSLYDEVAKQRWKGRKLPDADVLEVSRLSTFLPSCSKIELNECMRIWNQYETQSMDALMKSFHIRPDRMHQYFARYNIDTKEKIKKPWEDQRVQALFQDQAFIHAVTKEKEEKKRLLCGYLKQKGFAGQKNGTQDGRHDKIGIVDIGWRGTIQDNLCYLYPDHEIIGFYLGLHQFLSPQPPNSKKYGYINQSRICDLLLMFITPLEMLCNSPNGSTVSYQKQDGAICAVKRRDRQENAVFYQYTQKRQQEITSCISAYCRLAVKKQTKQTSEKQWKRHKIARKQRIRNRQANRSRQSYRAVYRLIAWPDWQTANAYFSLKHDETFGMGCCLDKRKTPRLRQFLKMCAVFYKKDVWITFLKETTWPQGYFVKYRLYPFLVAYNVILLYATRKKRGRKSEANEFDAAKKSDIQACD